MTVLFPPSDAPRVFALPPGADFAARLLAGMDARLAGQPPEAAARVTIFVNTERTRRRLVELMLDGPARIAPRIRVFADLGRDLPGPALSPLAQRLELAQPVRALLAAAPGTAAETAAFDLADSLARLLGEMQVEGVPFDALGRVEPPEEAAHWQRSLEFLRLLEPILAADTDLARGPEGRMRAAMAALAEAWRRAPPGDPVLVAGSTGSRGATALMMEAVARLPQGALVLPGLDPDLPSEVWEGLARDADQDHPQAPFAALGQRIGFDPGHVETWDGDLATPVPERGALISLALRPAPVTDQWRAEGPALGGRLAAATEGMTLIEAPDPATEAEALALALREAAETGTRAALVTPDRVLARRVTVCLDRWGIVPDDSAGRPLALTPPGVFLRLTADALAGPLGAVAFLRLLRHPLAGTGDRGRHLRIVRELELGFLRDGPHLVEPGALTEWAGAHGGAGVAEWCGWLAAALSAAQGQSGLAGQIGAHRILAETLSAGPEGAPAGTLWDEAAGEAARALFDELADAAPAAGDVPAAEYGALLRLAVGARDVPPEPYAAHPGIAIWGTLEARTQSAGLLLLGGLNEGTWPRLPEADPWLSREMRRRIGLPLPDRQIALSAHDFQQAVSAPRVVLSRALLDGGEPTVGARWLLRLQNLLQGSGPAGEAAYAAMLARGAARLGQVAALNRVAPAPPAQRPCPAPPVAARPARLSVTQIETLIRDPYAIYARHILGLRKLDPVGRRPDYAERGEVAHRVLERFVRQTADGVPPDAETLFATVARETLDETVPWPAIRQIWLNRLLRFAADFIPDDRARRETARPEAFEVRGQRELQLPDGPFLLTARADRIDRARDSGALGIYDYKTTPSSKKEIALFAKQMPLQGCIARVGGFDGFDAAPLFTLTLIGVNRNAKRVIDCEDDILEEDWRNLGRLIGSYRRADQGYPARIRVSHIAFDGDYDHLSRRGEWEDGDPFETEPVG